MTPASPPPAAPASRRLATGRRDAAGWALALGLAASALSAQDWPGFRGPAQDGTTTCELLEERGPLGLELDWKRPLGSGYASISVAGEVGVTSFSDGAEDFVTAFSAGTGDELWRHSLGETYRGHDGSSDGPLSTPAIAGGTVYALGPRGELLALDLETGAPRWRRDLEVAAGARAPQYGFATAPLVHGELVFVQTGGAGGRSVTAFDRATGTTRWAAGDDPVSYQSPAVLELAGRRRLIAVGDHFLTVLDPQSGAVALRYRHTADGEARGGSGLPSSLGDGRLLLRPGPDEVLLVELAESAAGLLVEESWRSDRALKRSHAAVVAHGGCLYSFDTQFLTCLDPESGERIWKSRPPGGRGLIRIGRYLAILGLRGEVVLVETDVGGYREAARLAVFDRGDWTPPSFAHGAFYVRNLSEMARVRIAGSPRDARADDAPQAPAHQGAIAGLARRLAAADDRLRIVDDFLAAQDAFPIVEDGGLVHFVYRGEADDVALSGNLTARFGEEVPMTRLAGTDLHVLSSRLDPDGHYEYRFHIDFGGGRTDPRNPLEIGSIFGASSELRMPGWRLPVDLVAPPRARGRFEAAVLGGSEVRVYLPPGYDGSQERYPLLWMQGGEGAASALVDRTLDHLIGERVAPLVAVVLPTLQREHDGDALEAYAHRLTGGFLHDLETRFRVLQGAAHRAILGSGGGAPVAAYLAFREPEIFGRLALQSFYLGGLFGKLGAGAFSLTPELQDDLRTLAAGSDRSPPAVYLEWNRQESRDFSSGLDVRADSEWLLETLRSRGITVHSRTLPGAPGWGSWRARHGEILEALFPWADALPGTPAADAGWPRSE